MNRFMGLVLVAGLLITVSGCGGSEGESLIKETIANMNDVSAAIEKKESSDKIKAAAQKMTQTMEKSKTVKWSKEEEAALQKKYEPQMKAAMERFFNAIKNNPEGAKAMGEMAMQKMQ